MFLYSPGVSAQEYAGHLFCNPALYNLAPPKLPALKTTATSPDPLYMPFVDDFTGYGIFPDSSKWADYNVYINNTMCNKPVSRGVATFDALNWRGIPYDSFSNTSFRYADSLTSQPINLSLNHVTPGDSIYLSFFYQPQGNGFYPLIQDSLMLFFRTKYKGYKKVWSVAGSTLEPFKQVMIPIKDSLFFDSFFQFRFINVAAQYWADAIWNVDYVRMNSGRTFDDTLINDVGFTTTPGFLFNDYTSMPYRQYFAYPAGERAPNYVCSLRNNNVFNQDITYGYSATALNTGSILKPISWNSSTIPSLTTNSLTFPAYTSLITLSSVPTYGKVVFENKHYIQSVSASDPKENDTVVKNQVFDNYLAYDDGTAEKSYYLNLYPTLPGKIAIEYHLNKPDTMRGMAIYFGRQVPFALNKLFDIKVYTALEGVNGSISDNVIYTQEYCIPGYGDSIDQFWVYKFDAPVPLPAGTFYAGTFQPAESGSDSLYFGLDVNRVGSNHAYFNVLSGWSPSLISGAIMMRPLLGQVVTGTGITEINTRSNDWDFYPNPAGSVIHFEYDIDVKAEYLITDLQGRIVVSGPISRSMDANVSSLNTGMYYVRVIAEGHQFAARKLVISK